MLIADRYELGDIIGTGGMSDVYAATDVSLGREVAVKMLKIDMARDENFRERFRREAQNSARLNHPNIVSVYDTGSVKTSGVDVPYIVMELVHGMNLRDIVRNEGPLSPERAAKLLLPVTRALQASHDAGIIHRDIKPANIMVTNTGAVKVMDFGIARALDDSTSAMTQTSAVIGTAQYLSPEQARGKPADARSDIYALGCVMYESVTGVPPFEGESPFAVAYQHVQEDPVPPSERISAPLSDNEAVNVDSVILTAMAKHPADRYQTADEMGADLALLERGNVTTAARNHLAAAEQDAGAHAVDSPAQDHTVVVGDVVREPVVRREASASSSGHTRYADHRAANEKTSSNWLKWLSALLGLLLAVAVSWFVYDYFSANKDTAEVVKEEMVPVPELADMPRNDAVRELEHLGFAVSVMEEPSPEIKRGNVISTNPAAGSELKRGTQITLTVSSGKEMTDVPDVTNLTAEEAIEELKKAGLELNPNVRRESSDNIEEGVILSQQPAGGTQIAKGSRIAITVSSGPEMVQVPSLVGLNVEQATATLSSLQLRSTVTSVDSIKPEGQVLAVAGENTDVESGTTIELRVSNGMLMNMPEITRKSPDEAEKLLRDAGWNGRLVPGPTVPTGALVDDGLIGHQEVASGETIRKDQAIGYNLWKFDAGKLIPQNNAAAGQADTVQPQNANTALRNMQRELGL
ncbi:MULTISPECIES: Stk1 family PASTA domain-containing Ser/Thr kinase [unclassified Corynebacterium]|uniref:Stk1 family PASTA domain-containing Ser/Thr kinase n=1 Tax=unclassified Corynebacterium TaxID=2624378 RepID=UPI001EF74492|nr:MULTISPECIES: Stk1 family PASTA domain-containing Ser/Thr kinase [unclassified Corynebacterium]MCG7289719.1 Stk1 family PASTA domain-containing Ser/Thr kinase [Corynebacterium sp. ACRPZ]MCG7293943.1 Stk1 family PASTA domain-containing Ser/Thr kinase [Corynebacterium sp. ACRPY]